MELTLTGASLNSDSRKDSVAKIKGNAQSKDGDCKKKCCDNSGLANSGAGGANAKGSPRANVNISTVSAQLNQKQCQKKCCEHQHQHGHQHGHVHQHGHQHHHQHGHMMRPQNYVDVKSIPRQKLTSNPAMLMNALVASIRGKGTFDTFTYLLQVVLDHEATLGLQSKESLTTLTSPESPSNVKAPSNTNESSNDPRPMPWGRLPTSPSSPTIQKCNSCLNHYSNEGHTIAHWCAKRNDDSRFLEHLTAQVPNIDINLPSLDDVGMRPIHWACTEGSIPNVAFILKHCQSQIVKSNNTASGSSSSENSPLMTAEENSSDTKNETSNNAVINTLDASCCTPLLIASQYGHADLVAFLIKRGANPYAIDNAGDTAFHWAAYKGSVPVCSLLLHLHCYHGHGQSNINDSTKTNGDLRGYLDLQDNFGQTPLHLSSLRGNVDVVNYIIEETELFVDRQLGELQHPQLSNEQPQTTDNYTFTDTETLLQSHDGIDDTKRQLNQFPAKLLHLLDKNGKSPLDLAIKKKHTPVEMVLRKSMDKYSAYNQSIIGKLKVTLSTFLSVKNWMLWLGFVSEGGGRPPKFIFWFVLINIFAACCLEVFVYSPIVWMTLKCILMRQPLEDIDDSQEILGSQYMKLHIATWIGYALSVASLYFVNQTDPGILISSSSLSSISATSTTHEYQESKGRLGRLSDWIQLYIRRVCSMTCLSGRACNTIGLRTTSLSWAYTSLSGLLCSCGNENKRIKREMYSLSMELHRQYEATLESFACMDSSAYQKEKKDRVLCHTSKIVRPKRSKHCRVINKSVLLFDHHCPFVGTTIGLYNYKYFYAFVTSITFGNILFTSTGILYYKHLDVVSNRSVWFILFTIYFSLYILMTGGLSIYHTQLIHMNLTTNEHQNLNKYKYLKKLQDDGSLAYHNPFDKGFIRNFMSRLFPGKDSYVVPGEIESNEKSCMETELDSSSIELTDKKTDDNGEKADLVANIV